MSIKNDFQQLKQAEKKRALEDKRSKKLQQKEQSLVKHQPYIPVRSDYISSTLLAAGFTREEVEKRVAEMLMFSKTLHKQHFEDPNTSNFDLIILSVIESAQKSADCYRMDNLLEKIFGKTIHISGKVDLENPNNTNININYGDTELIQRQIANGIAYEEARVSRANNRELTKEEKKQIRDKELQKVKNDLNKKPQEIEEI